MVSHSQEKLTRIHLEIERLEFGKDEYVRDGSLHCCDGSKGGQILCTLARSVPRLTLGGIQPVETALSDLIAKQELDQLPHQADVDH